jgi:hypothetical protein
VARPTDPEKLAALRARQAANSRAYRARKAAERDGITPPTPGTNTSDPTPRRRALPSSEAAVQRAHEMKAAARARRHEIVAGLTSARNPRVNIYTPREQPVTPAPMPDTAPKRRQRIKSIRERADAEKLQNIGRQRKAHYGDILANDPRADQMRKNLTRGQLARVTAVSNRLGRASQQTLAIFLQYEGGEGEIQSVLQQLAYPGQDAADVDDNLDRLEFLADTVERAETLYGPRAVGRLRI